MKQNLLSGFIGAIMGAVLSVIAVIYQTNKNFVLEKQQFESQLIVNSIDKTNKEQTINNIKFLIETGLISKENEKIIPLIDTIKYELKLPKKDTIFLSPKSGLSQIKVLGDVLSVQLVNEKNKLPLVNAEVFVNPSSNYSGEISSYYSYSKTDSNGIFEVLLPDKNYKLLIKYNDKILKSNFMMRKGAYPNKWEFNIE